LDFIKFMGVPKIKIFFEQPSTEANQPSYFYWRIPGGRFLL
jgi:hypothetical protein